MQGLILGLANGTVCLAYCAPVLVPYLLAGAGGVRQNSFILLQFLGGRLGGYLAFGALAWMAGELVGGVTPFRPLIFGAAYVGLALLLALHALSPLRAACAASAPGIRGWMRRWPRLVAAGLGFLTGLNLCPPFLLAVTDAASTGSLAQSLAFFFAFFLGTSVYFLPVPFIGHFNYAVSLRTIGRFAAALMALFYLYSGAILLAGGASQL